MGGVGMREFYAKLAGITGMIMLPVLLAVSYLSVA